MPWSIAIPPCLKWEEAPSAEKQRTCSDSTGRLVNHECRKEMSWSYHLDLKLKSKLPLSLTWCIPMKSNACVSKYVHIYIYKRTGRKYTCMYLYIYRERTKILVRMYMYCQPPLWVRIAVLHSRYVRAMPKEAKNLRETWSKYCTPSKKTS